MRESWARGQAAPERLELPCSVCKATVAVTGGARETPNPNSFCEIYKGECRCGAFVTYSAQGERPRA